VTVFLVHHGPAVDPSVDATRPLSQEGRGRVTRLAAAAAQVGVRPVVIWHSGKARARQTAELFWSACNPLASMTAVRGLLPADPPQWIADQLLAEEGDVMIVGHQPHLGTLWHLLDPESGGAPFPPHGIVGLEQSESRWRTTVRMELE
jgi:phosphohistidine phosphatase